MTTRRSRTSSPIPWRRSPAARPHRNPRIALPKDILGDRKNSSGFLLSDPKVSAPLLSEIEKLVQTRHNAAPIIAGAVCGGAPADIRDPADRRRIVGTVVETASDDARAALALAHKAQADWNALGGKVRAGILYRAADLFEANRPLLMALAVREAARRCPTPWARCARRSTSCAITPPAPRRIFRAAAPSRPDRRVQRADAARPRRLRLHQPVEFPALDLHRPGRRLRSPPAMASSPSPPSRRR